jgi:hypothetical protein
MEFIIGVARERCNPRAALAHSRQVQAVDQPAQLSPQPAVIFWGGLPLKALQLVFEFVQDRLQEFAPRMGRVWGTPRGA